MAVLAPTGGSRISPLNSASRASIVGKSEDLRRVVDTSSPAAVRRCPVPARSNSRESVVLQLRSGTLPPAGS